MAISIKNFFLIYRIHKTFQNHLFSKSLQTLYHVRYLSHLALGSSNQDPLHSKVASLAPKLTDPLGKSPPLLFLDPVYPIWIDSHVILFKDVYQMKYRYLETRSHCVNTSFIIIKFKKPFMCIGIHNHLYQLYSNTLLMAISKNNRICQTSNNLWYSHNFLLINLFITNYIHTNS